MREVQNIRMEKVIVSSLKIRTLLNTAVVKVKSSMGGEI